MVSNKMITYSNGSWRRYSKNNHFPKQRLIHNKTKETPTTYIYKVDLIKYLVSGRYKK